MPVDPDLILTCLQRNWSARPGADTLVDGWIFAGYAIAVLMSVLVVLRGNFTAERRARALWVIVAVFVLAVALVRFFDLQLVLTDTMRCVAHQDGWYRMRRSVQVQFALGAAAAVGATGLVLLWWLRKALLPSLPALVGCLVLAGLGGVRMASLGYIDNALQTPLLAVRIDRWTEGAGIALVIAGAVLVLAISRRSAAPPSARG